MKILVLSDSHGHCEEFLNYFNKMEEKVELILFLGDYIEDAAYIEKETGLEVIRVQGNNDFLDKKYKKELIFNINNVKILMSHGHLYNINFGIDRLYYRALEAEVDLVLFGHTHVPYDKIIDDILFLNPGSISRPRTLDRKKTFIILELGDKINYKFIKIN